MSTSPKAVVILRIAKSLMLLVEPHTVKELRDKLGLSTISCTHLYIKMIKAAGYPIVSQVRRKPGKGMNPTEYWIDYPDEVMRETMRMILRLRGI